MRRGNGSIIGALKIPTANSPKSFAGIFSLADNQQYRSASMWPRPVGLTGVGLIGRTYSGTWRSVIGAGNLGGVSDIEPLPMVSPTIYTSIGYSSLGDNYGFLAIGYFIPPSTGTYTFYTSSDDYSGVWVGSIASATTGRTTANATVDNGMSIAGGGQGDTKRSGTISLTADIPYAIRVVHEEGSGGDNLTFSWAGPGISETTALSTYFRFPRYLDDNSTYPYFIVL